MNEFNDLVLGVSFSAYQPALYEEKENLSKKIIFWGEDNMFPQYLLSLLSKSSLHAGIVKTKSQLIGGQGFLKTNLSMKTLLFLSNSNNDMDLDSVLFNCARDLEIFGGFSINLIWSRDRKSIAEINYIPISKVRINFDPTKPKFKNQSYQWSDGWENTQKYKPIYYQGFSMTNRKRASQILFVKEDEADTEYYCRPTYRSGLDEIETDWAISRYHRKGIDNGFNPSLLFLWPGLGDMSEEQKSQFVNRLQRQFGGLDNNQRASFIFPRSKDDVPEVIPIELNASDSRYIMLDDRTKDHIRLSHQIDENLTGESTPGKLGIKSEVTDSLERFQNNYVTPKQRILEKVFNQLAQINGVTDRLFIKKYTETFRKIDSQTDEVLQILQAQITPEQKYFFLLHKNFDSDTAHKLSGYVEGEPQTVTPPEKNDTETK